MLWLNLQKQDALLNEALNARYQTQAIIVAIDKWPRVVDRVSIDQIVIDRNIVDDGSSDQSVIDQVSLVKLSLLGLWLVKLS